MLGPQQPLPLRVVPCMAPRLALVALLALGINHPAQTGGMAPPEASGSRVLSQFSERTTRHSGTEAELRRMTFDFKRGRLYVGAVNSVYSLAGADLDRVGTWVAGPMDDSLDCPYDPNKNCPSGVNRTPTSSANQLLLIDTDADVLIACGTLFYGSCDHIDLSDFTPVDRPAPYRPTVPNDPTRPVVAFFVPASRLTYDVGGVYVGAGYSARGSPQAQGLVHMLTARRAGTLEYMAGGTSFVDALPHYRGVQYPIEFVEGFEYDGYAYYVITRRDSFSVPGSVGTYVLRHCLNDPSLLHSLIELRLECEGQQGYARTATHAGVGKRLGDVMGANVREALYVAFAAGGDSGGGGGAQGGTTAICAYGMKRLDEMFQRATASCFSGVGTRGPPYIVDQKGAQCVKKSVVIPSDYCGEHAVNFPVSDATPVRATYRLVLQGEVARSMVVSVVNDVTVAFIGTAGGRLLKVALRNSTSSAPFLYGIVTLDQRAPLVAPQPIKSLVFGSADLDGLHSSVYALTNASVYQVSAFDCGAFNSCELCITDPHCGWCATTNRCARKSACPAAGYWIAERCPHVVTLDPHSTPRDLFTATRLSVVVSSLPAQHRRVRCVVEDARLPGVALEDLPALIDVAPPALPPVPPGGAGVVNAARRVHCGPFSRQPADGPFVVNVTLKLVVDDALWTSAVVSVYNCQRVDQCAACAQARHPCRWCVQRHSCMTASLDCTAPTGARGLPITEPGRCARVEVANNATLLVAAEQRGRVFSFIGYNLMGLHQPTLRCRFKMADRSVYATAKFVSLPSGVVTPQILVTCDPVDLFYAGAEPLVSAPFDLVWGQDLALDNPQQLAVRVYKCRRLVSNCGLCLTLPPAYECGWCSGGAGGAACALKSDCAPPSPWLDRNQTCPNPLIVEVSPGGGPLRGGTLLTIRGVNLGKTPADLTITVGAQPCVVQAEGYLPSQSVVCRTAPAVHAGPSPVVVTVRGGHATSPNNLSIFVYQDPTLTPKSLTPTRGPVSGGTRVTLSGTGLHLGSTVHVHVNGLHAHVIIRTATQLEFLTPNISAPGQVYTSLQVDDMAAVTLRQPFTYTDDPVVSTTEPRISLVSGGSVMEVTGRNLDVVQKPLLIVYHRTGNKTSPCTIRSSTKLECLTPSLSDAGSQIASQVDLAIGFVMDNVTQLLRQMRVGGWVRSVTYFPDPVVIQFARPVRYSSDELLVITGKNLELLHHFRDLGVTVGGAKCWIDSPAVGEAGAGGEADVVRCKPPTPQDKKELNAKKQALVVLTLGNFRREVGVLSYDGPPHRLPLILGLTLGLALPLLLACIIALIVCRWKRRRGRGNKPGPPGLLEMDVRPPYQPPHRHSNPYQGAGGARGVSGGEGETERCLGDKDEGGEEEGGAEGKDDLTYLEGLLRRMDNKRLRSAARDVFIERERLELGNLLGKGHFGRVYAATLRDAEMKEPRPVAVKTIEDQDLNVKLMESFLEEGIIMKNFDHPHVLSLIGLCLGYKKEPMVILPFMAHGDLRSYVKDKHMSFTARQLLLLSQQVAEGMAYLSNLNFIHRDLAARNCMIDEENVVKVADFGLSHELYDREYYASKDPKSKLPIKWMALESLEEFIFTTKSDVWSFGVLMWELMTRGVTPYPDVEVFETRNYLASGRRLRKPKYCPDNVFAIMVDCWHEAPEHRPTFSELVNRLEALLTPPPGAVGGQGGSGSLSRREPMYLNMAESQEYLKPAGGEERLESSVD